MAVNETKTGKRTYPYLALKFKVEINGIESARASEVSGLSIETETEPYEEGGVNDYVHQLHKRTKYQRIILKRGIGDKDDLWKWYQEVVNGKFERMGLSIILMDINDNDKWRWDFIEAYPVKWTGPELKADSNAIAFETLEFAHHGLSKG